jgi:hypothetical protein
MRSAHPIDLTWVWRAHDPHEKLVTLRFTRREVTLDEEGSFGRASPHDHASNSSICAHGEVISHRQTSSPYVNNIVDNLDQLAIWLRI